MFNPSFSLVEGGLQSIRHFLSCNEVARSIFLSIAQEPRHVRWVFQTIFAQNWQVLANVSKCCCKLSQGTNSYCLAGRSADGQLVAIRVHYNAAGLNASYEASMAGVTGIEGDYPVTVKSIIDELSRVGFRYHEEYIERPQLNKGRVVLSFGRRESRENQRRLGICVAVTWGEYICRHFVLDPPAESGDRTGTVCCQSAIQRFPQPVSTT